MKGIFLRVNSNKLIKNGIYYTVGGFLIQGINFFTIPIYTRLLSPEDYGIISVYNTWFSIISIFVILQTYGSISNARIKYEKKEFEEYISNILALSFFSFIIWMFIFYFLKNFFFRIIKLDEILIWLILIQSFFNIGITYKISILVETSKPKKRLLISFINLILNTLISIYLIKYIYTDTKYIGRIVGGIIPTILLGIYCFFCILKKSFPTYKKEHWKYCLGISIPLVFHGFSNLILSSSDRLMLEEFSGMKETGIYSFIYNIGMIINILWGSFNSAWVPWFYDRMKNNEIELMKNYAKYYFYFFTFLCSNFLLVSPEIIKLMSPIHYWSGLEILPWIVMSYYLVFCYSFPVNCEFYYEKTRYIAIGTTLAAILNILFNFYFIPKSGANGAALATFLAYIFLFVLHEFIVRKKINIRIIETKNYVIGNLYLLLICLFYNIFLNRLLWRYLYLVIFDCIVFIYLYKKLIKENKEIK